MNVQEFKDRRRRLYGALRPMTTEEIDVKNRRDMALANAIGPVGRHLGAALQATPNREEDCEG